MSAGFAEVPDSRLTFEGTEWLSVEKTSPASKFISGDFIQGFHFIGLVFAGLVAMMLAIGSVSPRSEPWEHQHSGDVDITPWSMAWPLAIVLVLLVLGIYWWFADFSVLR